MNQDENRNIDLQFILSQEIFSIAKDILENKIDPLQGARLLSSYRPQINKLQDELLFFTGIASQTDEFPLSEDQRKLWSAEALARLDVERKEFLSSTEELIRANCSSILSTLEL